MSLTYVIGSLAKGSLYFLDASILKTVKVLGKNPPSECTIKINKELCGIPNTMVKEEDEPDYPDYGSLPNYHVYHGGVHFGKYFWLFRRATCKICNNFM